MAVYIGALAIILTEEKLVGPGQSLKYIRGNIAYLLFKSIRRHQPPVASERSVPLPYTAIHQ